MQRMMINIKSTGTFINYVLVTLWYILQTIIDGISSYKPLICKFIIKSTNIILIIYNFMYVFTETLYDKGFDDKELIDKELNYKKVISPKKQLIDKSWCNIDPNNIINDDKKRM